MALSAASELSSDDFRDLKKESLCHAVCRTRETYTWLEKICFSGFDLSILSSLNILQKLHDVNNLSVFKDMIHSFHQTEEIQVDHVSAFEIDLFLKSTMIYMKIDYAIL